MSLAVQKYKNDSENDSENELKNDSETESESNSQYIITGFESQFGDESTNENSSENESESESTESDTNPGLRTTINEYRYRNTIYINFNSPSPYGFRSKLDRSNVFDRFVLEAREKFGEIHYKLTSQLNIINTKRAKIINNFENRTGKIFKEKNTLIKLEEILYYLKGKEPYVLLIKKKNDKALCKLKDISTIFIDSIKIFHEEKQLYLNAIINLKNLIKKRWFKTKEFLRICSEHQSQINDLKKFILVHLNNKINNLECAFDLLIIYSDFLFEERETFKVFAESLLNLFFKRYYLSIYN